MKKRNWLEHLWIALICVITFKKVCPYCNPRGELTMANTVKELEEQIKFGKRRCVCTEEYYCNTCRELENLKKKEA